MVHIKKIENIINNIINKHLHSEFGTNIRKTLHQITDNKQDYTILRNTIFDFYQKYNSEKQKEHLQVQDYNNKTYTQEGYDDTHEVLWSKEMMDSSLKNGLMYSIHNHPTNISVQSFDDIEVLLKGNVKYSITLGADGLMIIKNNNPFTKINPPYYKNNLWWSAYQSFNKWNSEINEKCRNEYSKEYNDINNRFDNNQITQEQADNEWNNISNKYFKENSHEIVKDYSNIIEGANINLELHHIPKNKRR